MDLVSKGFVTDQLVVTIGYDIENLTDPERRRKYHGEIVKDHYGRQIPKHAHGTINLERYTSSTKQIMDAAGELFDRITDKDLLIRRLNITATHVIDEASPHPQQREFSASRPPLLLNWPPDPKGKRRSRTGPKERGASNPCQPTKKSWGRMPFSRG